MKIAYDTRRQVTVGIGGGGTDGSLLFLPVSEYDGTRWISRYEGAAANTPRFRFFPQVTFDSVRGVTVVFAGAVGTNIFNTVTVNELWEYDGSRWTQRTWMGTGPKAGTGEGFTAEHYAEKICFDPNRGRTVCLIDAALGSGADYETWEWTGVNWERGGDLTGVIATDMVFDDARNRAFVYGEKYDKAARIFVEKIWEYLPGSDGVRGVWKEVPINAPPTEYIGGVSLVYHPRLRLVLRSCGYGQAYNDFRYVTHVWDPVRSNWKLLEDGNLPQEARRASAAVCYDRGRDVLVVYRGTKPPNGGPTEFYTDMWEWDDHNPAETYVNFANFGDQNGSADHPWRNLSDGLKHSPVSGTIFLRAGSTAETLSSSDYRATPVFLRAVNGPVVIGRR